LLLEVEVREVMIAREGERILDCERSRGSIEIIEYKVRLLQIKYPVSLHLTLPISSVRPERIEGKEFETNEY